MIESTPRQYHAKILRTARKIHRFTGVFLFAFFFILAVTGILLGWKKNSGGLILAKSQQGTSTDLKKWLPLDSLHRNACQILHDSISPNLSTELERIDVRKDKGMVKFIFADHFWGLQIDGVTGKLLKIEQRRADFIENIHDGSIIDKYMGLKSGAFKLFYNSLMGTALLIFTITGFWLWYGPRYMKKHS